MARPTKLTLELQQRMVALVTVGNFPVTAAKSCGIATSTFYRWQKLANEEDED